MAFSITAACIDCWACLDVCPNAAIAESDAGFVIDARRCTECVGDFAEPQCAAICPVECAIVDELGCALNPPGSLSGLPLPPPMTLRRNVQTSSAECSNFLGKTFRPLRRAVVTGGNGKDVFR